MNGYVNNLATHRIEIDGVRGPLIAELFKLYASGSYSLKAVVANADVIGLRLPRTNRLLYKSDDRLQDLRSLQGLRRAGVY